jgi:hypothetical protein
MHKYWDHVKKQLLAYSGVAIIYSIFYGLSVYFKVRDAEAIYTQDFIPVSIFFIFGGAALSYYMDK